MHWEGKKLKIGLKCDVPDVQAMLSPRIINVLRVVRVLFQPSAAADFFHGLGEEGRRTYISTY